MKYEERRRVASLLRRATLSRREGLCAYATARRFLRLVGDTRVFNVNTDM